MRSKARSTRLPPAAGGASATASCRRTADSLDRLARLIRSSLLAALAALVSLSACQKPAGPPGTRPGESDRLRLLATTTILGDVVRQIGGEAVSLSVLLPPHADPHTFEPAPQDLIALSQADLVFVNGAGLEQPLLPRLENALGEAGARKIISASEGLELLRFAGGQADPDHPAAGGYDPHVWFDPNNVIHWTYNIERALSQRDAANAEAYAANAEAYREQLRALDAWIREQVARIPSEDRKLVTDHLTLGYFAARYGFEQIGAVIPGFSTAAEPSAQQLAELETAIRQADVRAIFVGTTVNPRLAERVADDTGIRLVSLYTETGDYLELMKYDVNAIVEALEE